jgi:hypothetical protein
VVEAINKKVLAKHSRWSAKRTGCLGSGGISTGAVETFPQTLLTEHIHTI